MEVPGAEAPQAPRSSAEGSSLVERRRREDRGAKGAEGWDLGRGVPSPPEEGLRSGLCPLPRKRFDF